MLSVVPKAVGHFALIASQDKLYIFTNTYYYTYITVVGVLCTVVIRSQLPKPKIIP